MRAIIPIGRLEGLAVKSEFPQKTEPQRRATFVTQINDCHEYLLTSGDVRKSFNDVYDMFRVWKSGYSSSSLLRRLFCVCKLSPDRTCQADSDLKWLCKAAANFVSGQTSLLFESLVPSRSCAALHSPAPCAIGPKEVRPKLQYLRKI